MDNFQNLLIYDRMPLLISKTPSLKKTKEFEARLEEAAVLPYLVPGHGLTMVLRPLELVTSPTRIAAYKNLVVCDGHPPDGTAHKVGKGLVLSAEVFNDGLNGSIVIHDEALLEKIYEDGITELSPGYMADLVYAPGEFKGVSYTHRHANYAIGGVERLEHQAIVKHGRHGGSTALKIEDGMTHAVALTWEESRSVIDLGNTKITKDEDDGMKKTLVEDGKDALDEAIEEVLENAANVNPETAAATMATAVTLAAVDKHRGGFIDMSLEDFREMIEKLLLAHVPRSAGPCPECAARNGQNTTPSTVPANPETPPTSIEAALQLDEDAIGGVIELARTADSLGVAYEVSDLTRDMRSVQNKVAAKLNLKVEDGYSDREVGILIRGSMATAPVKTTGIGAAVNAIKAAQAKAATTPKVKTENPLTGLV